MNRGLRFLILVLWASAALGTTAQEAGMPVTVIPSMQRPAAGPASTAQSWTAGPYTYDGAGNIKAIGTDRFTYDRMGRLVTARTEGAPSSYSYDRFGNVQTMTLDGTTVALGPDPTTNRITNTTGASGAPANYGTYDAAGRVTALSDGSSYGWDATGMMVSSSGTAGSNRKVYVYTANDERIVSIVVNGTAEGASEWTLRDTGGKVLRRIERAGPGASWVWREDYIYAGARLLASEIDTAPRTLHYFSDHLGSPRLVTGNGGMKVAEHAYFPFGSEAPPAVIQSAAMPAGYDRLRFTSHERDSTKLDYMHARYYSAGVGRFLSVDPVWASVDLGKPQTWNRYAYVENDPVNKVDPDGRAGRGIGSIIRILPDKIHYRRIKGNVDRDELKAAVSADKDIIGSRDAMNDMASELSGGRVPMYHPPKNGQKGHYHVVGKDGKKADGFGHLFYSLLSFVPYVGTAVDALQADDATADASPTVDGRAQEMFGSHFHDLSDEDRSDVMRSLRESKQKEETEKKKK